MAGPLVGLGDGGCGQAECCDTGAGIGAGSQVAGYGEGVPPAGCGGLRRHTVVEQPPLGAVDALGIFGEDGLQGVGRPGRRRAGPAQRREGGGRSGGRRWWSRGVSCWASEGGSQRAKDAL